MITEYLDPLFDTDQLKIIIREAARIVKRLKPEAIVCRGVSGVAIAFAVSAATSVPVGVVRKRDGSHSSLTYEGVDGFTTYVVIDDLVDTGKTLKRIKKELKESVEDRHPLVCLGVLTYCSGNIETDKKVRDILDTEHFRISST